MLSFADDAVCGLDSDWADVQRRNPRQCERCSGGSAVLIERRITTTVMPAKYTTSRL